MITAHFTKGFRVSSDLAELYNDVEATMSREIESMAKKVDRTLYTEALDDIKQEARCAALAALAKYQYEKGSLDRYISRVISNTLKRYAMNSLSPRRVPRVVVRKNGEWKTVAAPPLSLDEITDAGAYEQATPEDTTSNGQLEEAAKIFHLRMLNKLKGRDKSVFVCKVNPSSELQRYIENIGGNISEVPSNTSIARFLGLSKNAVDWSLYKIRAAFMRVAREEKELYGEAMKRSGWPMFHISRAPFHDRVFVRRMLLDRNLDPRPLMHGSECEDSIEISDENARMVDRYSWGVVVVLKRGDEWRTLVIECEKWNSKTGDAYGPGGIRESCPLRWYRSFAKRLSHG